MCEDIQSHVYLIKSVVTLCSYNVSVCIVSVLN